MTDRATHRTPNGPPTGPAARPGRGAGQPPQDPPDHQEARDDDHDPQDGNQDPPDGGHDPRDSAPDPRRDRGPDPAQLGDPAGTARADRPHRRNTRLAALIAEAGFSHAGLARRVDRLGQEHGLDLRYDKTSVTRWLRGQQPRGTSPALIAEVFTQRLGRRLSAQDLGLDACAPVYAGLEYAATAGEAVDIVSGLWRKDTGSQAELRKIAFSPAGLVVPSRDWLIGSADDTVVRKAAERVPAQNRGMSRAAQDLRPAAPNSAGRVGAGDIAALRAVGDLFRTLDHAYGGGHARQALIRYLEHEAEPMLRGSYGETQGRRLFASVADLTRLAGWTSYDIGAHGLAQRYFVQALRLTQAAGDRIHGGYVLVTMSRQAVHLGHGREAVQLARVAQQGIGTGAPGAVQALTYAAEARGHGVLGDSRACTAALVRAERAFGAARPGDELPSWARFFDEAQLADEFGHCHRDLQQHRAAAQQAERSLQLRAPGYARSRLFCRAVLASARLSLGDLDAACALGAEVVRQAADMRSVRAAEYARDFARRLDPYRDTSAARAFYVRAEAAGFPL
ncbi:proline-rich domain-containing protein [Streptomyces sp. NBC_01477]|uniref:proline-rich domain-containing protein n=1 Tax=Streptomyces sp. NBC_01477 TaxID=2976015 RepID=UPI002E346CFB|nr:proline-rich domain-containing protein [Streptomyces sp. NBC_01477]